MDLQAFLYRRGLITRPYGSKLGETEPTLAERLSLMAEIAVQAYPIGGVDVSRWQGVIDWPKLAAKAYFAIIQSSYGSANIDSAYAYNIKEAHKQNIGIGIYHYLKPDKDFRKTAQLFYTVWRDSGSHLPPCFDLEETGGLDKNGLNNWMEKFLKAFYELAGRDGIFGMGYYSKSFIDTYVMLTPTFDWLKNLDCWIANWTAGPSPALPTVFSKFAKPKTWKIWQDSSKGIGADYGAASPNIDHDRYYGDLNTFNAEYGTNLEPRGVPVPPPPTPTPLSTLMVHTPGGINVRSGPGTQYPIVGGLPYSTIITPTNIGGANAWVEIAPGHWACFSIDTGTGVVTFMEKTN